MDVFQTEEWEKTTQLIKQAVINFAIYSTKGNLLKGDQNTPFMDTDTPDTKEGYLFLPVKIDTTNVILASKPVISIDKTVRIIQRAIDLLNMTLEKKEEHEQLLMKYSYLQNISQAKNVYRLVQSTAEFLVHKLKLANCSVILGNEKHRYFETKTSEIYLEAENIIHKQSENTKVTNRISSIKEDFMLKNIEKIEELPESMFSIPLISNKQYLGTIFCYLDKIDNKKINKAEIIVHDFAKNISLLSELQEAKTNAQTDNLTGLLNRSLLFSYLDKTIATNFREEKATSLLIFDIDDFKKYNDTYGHLKGDEILRRIAREVKKINALSFRYGGEEFVTILSCIEPNETKEIAEDLRKSVEENCELTISVGCITCSNSTVSSHKLLDEADKALYKAKNLGKNKVVQFVIVDNSLGVVDMTQA